MDNLAKMTESGHLDFFSDTVIAVIFTGIVTLVIWLANKTSSKDNELHLIDSQQKRIDSLVNSIEAAQDNITRLEQRVDNIVKINNQAIGYISSLLQFTWVRGLKAPAVPDLLKDLVYQYDVAIAREEAIRYSNDESGEAQLLVNLTDKNATSTLDTEDG